MNRKTYQARARKAGGIRFQRPNPHISYLVRLMDADDKKRSELQNTSSAEGLLQAHPT